MLTGLREEGSQSTLGKSAEKSGQIEATDGDSQYAALHATSVPSTG